jgi:hypothetical protein
MQRPGSLMRSEVMKSEGARSEVLACPRTWSQQLGLEDPVSALQDECKRLQFLVGELVLKNHEMRSQVRRLRDEKQEFSG